MHWFTPCPRSGHAAWNFHYPSAGADLCSFVEGLLRGLWCFLCSLPRLQLHMALQWACFAGVSALGAVARADRPSLIHILCGSSHDASERNLQCFLVPDASKAMASSLCKHLQLLQQSTSLQRHGWPVRC